MNKLTLIFWANSSASDSQDGFFDSTIWILVLVPLIAAFVIGIANKRKKQTVRQYSKDEFEREVLGADEPTLVHFYNSWHIGDQCMIAQTEKIATYATNYRVGFVDVQSEPELLQLYSRIESPALLLFAGGKRIWQSEGVFDENDIHPEVLEAIARWERNREPSPAREH